MLVVGLTGGIATGKSTVARMFERLGAVIIDADQIAYDLVEPNQPAWQKIIDCFGPTIVQANGQLKRKVLARKVFGEDKDRFALNAIMHPPIIAEIQRQINELSKKQPDAIVIVEAPLLFEVEWPFEWDKIIVVCSNQVIQFERLCMKEPKMSQPKFKKRLRSQLPLDGKAERADWVIQNNGSLSATKDQVAIIYQDLQQLAEDGI